MPTKIKRISKISLLIITLPITCNLLYYLVNFILQLGRIVGTVIRIIMSL